MFLSVLCSLAAVSFSTASNDAIGDYSDDFTLVLTLQNPSGGDVDIGADAFNEMFRLSERHILKRECDGCGSDHQVVYYKRRHGTFAFFDLYSNTYDWSSTHNTLGNQFNLYSSLDDALAGNNAWTYCNYDDPGIGMFRDCGPDGHVAFEWTSRERGGDAARFYIYTPGTGTLSLRGERYGFVKTGVCEDYGMDSIHDAAECENAANVFGEAAGIDSDFNFEDKTDSWGGHWSRPTGCSWHAWGTVEQWPTAAQDTCDSWGFSGCFCSVSTSNEMFMIVDGNTANTWNGNGHKSPECTSATSTNGIASNDYGTAIAVQCCNSEGTAGNRPGCRSGVTFAIAEQACADDGGRLCTQSEVEAHIGAGMGCNFDGYHVWTSTPCNSLSASASAFAIPDSPNKNVWVIDFSSFSSANKNIWAASLMVLSLLLVVCVCVVYQKRNSSTRAAYAKVQFTDAETVTDEDQELNA